MTLSMKLLYRNPDASADVNLRFKDVFQKGFVTLAAGSGLEGRIIPSGVDLTVTVDPFVCVTFDGAVVLSDATSAALPVADGVLNYVVLRARYRLLDSPILELEVLSAAAYGADPELDWLHVVGTVDLTAGGFTNPTNTEISYTERDALDRQARSFWREPVATSGALPTPPFTTSADHNRDGDVRLVLDTGSFYWWNEGLASWEVFDEVPLIAHRDHEHTNGITGDSASTTLVPSVSALNMRVGPVAAGSGYVVNGRYLTAPLVNTDVSAAGVGATRGLLQVSADQNGTISGSYRITKDVDALDITAARLVNISDNHSTGTFTLVFDTGGNTLSWDSGEPVPVTTSGTYRLYRPDYSQWVEVTMSGALPGIGVADSYVVSASKKDDDNFLIGYYYWDGAATLVLGADKRYFGTTGYADLSTDFKEVEFHPRWNDLRGNMVYSGGEVSNPSGLLLRVTGPIITYLEGIRYEVAGSFAGISIPALATHYIYVDGSVSPPVLTNSATDPATVPGLVYAEVALVVAGAVTLSTMTDRRDPQIIVGNATRNSRAWMTGDTALLWSEPNNRFVTEQGGAGASTGVELETGVLRVSDDEVAAVGGGALTFSDANTPSAQALTDATYNDLTDFQPGNATPSVFGTLNDVQALKRYNVGVESGCAPSIGAGTSVDIASGAFYDVHGHRVVLAAPVNVPISTPVADGVYAIAWDPDSGGSWKSVNLTTGNGCDIQDLPFAVAVLNGAGNAVSSLENVKRMSDGNYDRSYVTVGPAQGVQDANFLQLRAALLHIMCFDDDEPAPKLIKVIGNITEAVTASENAAITISFSAGFPWADPPRLSNIEVVGVANTSSASTTVTRPVITWTSTSGPLIDFNQDTLDGVNANISNFRFRNLMFNASGTASATDHRRCLFRNAGHGFGVEECGIDGNNVLSHVMAWSQDAILGGEDDVVFPRTAATFFKNVYAADCTVLNSDGVFYFGDNTGTNTGQCGSIDGVLLIEDSVFECETGNEVNNLVFSDAEADTDTSNLSVRLRGATVARMDRLFSNLAMAHKVVDSSLLLDVGGINGSLVSGTAEFPVLSNTTFGGTCSLTGAGKVVNCTLQDSAVLTVGSASGGPHLMNCDFGLGTIDGTLFGATSCKLTVSSSGLTLEGFLRDCTMNLGTSAVITVTGTLTSPTTAFNTTFTKNNDNATANTVVQATTANTKLVMDHCTFTNSGTSTNTAAVINVTGSGARFQGSYLQCNFSLSGPPNAPIVSFTSAGASQLDLAHCVLASNTASPVVAVRSGDDATPGSVVRITDNHLTQAVGGSLEGPLVLIGGTSVGFWEFGYVENNFLNLLEGTHLGVFESIRRLTMRGNVWKSDSSSDVDFLIGNGVGSGNTAGTLVFSDNTLRISGQLEVVADTYQRQTYTNNFILAADIADTKFIDLDLTGDHVIFSHNMLAGSGPSNASIAVSVGITVSENGVGIGNQVYADGDGTGAADANLFMVGSASVAKMVLNNNIIKAGAATAAGSTDAALVIAGSVANSGFATMVGNVVEANNSGNTGITTAVLSADNCTQAQISGNTVKCTKVNGSGVGDANIEVTDTSFVTVTGNTVVSNVDALLSVLDSTSGDTRGVVLGNVVNGFSSTTITNTSTVSVTDDNITT